MTDTKDRTDVVLRLSEPATSDGVVVKFGDVLRRYRESQKLTQEKAAELAQVSRATFTQWESGRHLPLPERIQQLDQLLEAGGELISAAAGSRARPPAPRTAPVTAPRAEGPPLGLVLRRAHRVLLARLVRDGDRPVGWRHNLVESSEPVSTLSTIYALKALALLDGPVSVGPLSPVVDRVLTLGRDNAGRLQGWRSSTQRAPRLESTGAALDALLRAGVSFDVDDIVRIVDTLLDETARQRPLALTVGLEPLLRVAPDSELTTRMVRALLDCRVEFGGSKLWPEKRLSREQPMLDPSLAHTARAVAVLRDAPEELVGDAVSAAEQWITDQTNLGGVTEIVKRSLDEGGREETAFDHFTAAWVVRALAGADRPARSAISRALSVVWERYEPAHRLWAWGNGDTPVWMLGDAIAALQRAALALETAPAGSAAEPLRSPPSADSG